MAGTRVMASHRSRDMKPVPASSAWPRLALASGPDSVVAGSSVKSVRADALAEPGVPALLAAFVASCLPDRLGKSGFGTLDPDLRCVTVDP